MSDPVFVDTHGITREMEGKRLRITFDDGETAEIRITSVQIHDCHEDCNGIVYDVLSSNKMDKYRLPLEQSAFWSEFQYIVSVEQI
jgi:hypothetical protein